MPVIPHLVIELVGDLEPMTPALKEIEKEWEPDQAPLISSMGDVGRAFAKNATALSLPNVVAVFQRVEAILREGTDEEKDAVATGFLEAVAAVLDDSPERMRILQYAGPEAQHYLAEWDRFCGIQKD